MTPASSEVFRAQLLASGVLAATDEEGLYARSNAFERIALAFDALISRQATALGAQRWHFPPIQARTTFERTGYLVLFPHLAGSVSVFTGDDRRHAELLRQLDAGEDWSEQLSTAPMALCSACCQPLYPMLSGRLSAEELLFDVTGWCFRHEPSRDPYRMQTFRQHDIVYMGTREGVRGHLDGWLDRGARLLASLDLHARTIAASDPFFGHMRTIMTTATRGADLKHELVVAVSSDNDEIALMSANEHRGHFSSAFGIELADGTPAETACVGFGLERVTLALLDRHGLDPESWPTSVRKELGL